MRKFLIPGLELVAAILFAALLATVLNRVLAQDGLDLPIDPKTSIPGGPSPPKTITVPPVQPPPVTPIPTTPKPTIYGHEILSENKTVVFILDISASMNMDQGSYTTFGGQVAQGSRLDRAKAALEVSIDSLTPDWKFDIIIYDCAASFWRSEMVKATPEGKKAAETWVDGVGLGGATGTGPAVVLAFNTFADNRLAVLLTDGAPNCGAGDELGGPSCIEAHRTMIKGNNHGVVVNVFGIGATGDFKQFCQDVASDSGGTYNDIR